MGLYRRQAKVPRWLIEEETGRKRHEAPSGGPTQSTPRCVGDGKDQDEAALPPLPHLCDPPISEKTHAKAKYARSVRRAKEASA